jgi:hypothetical protein
MIKSQKEKFIIPYPNSLTSEFSGVKCPTEPGLSFISFEKTNECAQTPSLSITPSIITENNKKRNLVVVKNSRGSSNKEKYSLLPKKELFNWSKSSKLEIRRIKMYTKIFRVTCKNESCYIHTDLLRDLLARHFRPSFGDPEISVEEFSKQSLGLSHRKKEAAEKKD